MSADSQYRFATMNYSRLRREKEAKMSSPLIDRLRNFTAGIKGISAANRSGLLEIARLLEQEQQEREEAARFALQFYADKKRYESSNALAIPDDPYTELSAPYMQDIYRDWGEFARSALRTMGK